MTPTVLFIVLAAAVVVGTALALAGRWQPQGLPAQAPSPRAGAAEAGARFDVVLRGYRMEQVDAEIARLHAMLAAAARAGQHDEVQAGCGDPTIGG